MHTGCVPVVTPVRGFADFVEEGRSGLVVAFNDVPGAARALDLLARDRGRLAELREGALTRAAQLPSLDEQAERLAAVLAGLPRGERPPQRLMLGAVAAVEVVAGERRALEQYARDLQQEVDGLQRDNAEVAELRRTLAERQPAYRVGNALRPLWRPFMPLARLLRKIRR